MLDVKELNDELLDKVSGGNIADYCPSYSPSCQYRRKKLEDGIPYTFCTICFDQFRGLED